MKQNNPTTRLAPLAPISCSNCQNLSRLVGLEPAFGGENLADLCTYECQACGTVQTRVFLRSATGRAAGGDSPLKGNGQNTAPTSTLSSEASA